MLQSSLKSPLIGEVEAAEILALSVKTLRRWRWGGSGPRFIKLGGAVRYDIADLLAFIEQNRKKSTSEPVS
jgi:predicted DNA-binding transcriptional regulator AlpA